MPWLPTPDDQQRPGSEVVAPCRDAGEGDDRAESRCYSKLFATPTNLTLSCSASEPSLCFSSSTVRRQRPGSGRFRDEEMTCFKRLPWPSATCTQKAEVYVQSTLAHKRALSESGLHTLPAMKGEFYRFSADHFHLPVERGTNVVRAEVTQDVSDELPLERQTTAVLNQIYPCPHDRDDKPARKATMTRHRLTNTALLAQVGDDKPKSKDRSGHRQARRHAAQQNLLQFRQKLLDKFVTMQGAFDSFAHEIAGGLGRELSRKDFSRFLNKHFPGLSRDEHARVFAFLDTNKNGTISIAEFHTAIEAVAPVRSMEDFRRKLIALGYTSMRQVLKEIEYATLGKKQMTFQDFAQALTRVGICEDIEHQLVFQTILDPHAGSKTASVEQLASALSAVSPSILLEDIRDRLLQRYGNITAAYNALDIDCSISIDGCEFLRSAMQCWKISPFEANKAFQLIDTDKSRLISRQEFASAMMLAEPSLFLEDIRRKVRQRFRSIGEALLKDEFGLSIARPFPKETATSSKLLAPAAAKGESPSRLSTPDCTSGSTQRRREPPRPSRGILSNNEQSLEDVLNAFNKEAAQEEGLKAQTPAIFRETLAKVQLTESETSALFALVDIDGDGELTPLEFSRGIRLFAPACILDDLRLRCLARHSRVADAFASISAERRQVIHNAETLRQTLEELDLAEGVNVEAIVDLVEPHKEGGMTISELVSALQAAAPGRHMPLPPDLRDARAKQQVKAQMAPFLSSAKDLRHDVRQKPLNKEDEDEPCKPRPALPLLSSKRRQDVRSPQEDQGEDGEGDEIAGRKDIGPSTSATPWPMRQSYIKVSRQLRILGPADSDPIVQRLQGYYTTAGAAVSRDSKLLSTSQSRFQHFRSLSGHRAVIHRPASTKISDGSALEQPP